VYSIYSLRVVVSFSNFKFFRSYDWSELFHLFSSYVFVHTFLFFIFLFFFLYFLCNNACSFYQTTKLLSFEFWSKFDGRHLFVLKEGTDVRKLIQIGDIHCQKFLVSGEHLILWVQNYYWICRSDRDRKYCENDTYFYIFFECEGQ